MPPFSRAVITEGAVASDEFRRDVISGLTETPKRLPCKYFYDERGSALFDQICELEEYYLTRTELSIMRAHVARMAAGLGEGCLIVELGSGSSLKTRLLLEELKTPAGYVPVDISREHMTRWARALSRDFPRLTIRPIHADFSRDFKVPDLPAGRRVVYFPGSTVGNFSPAETDTLLRRVARVAGPGGGLLIGIDLKKDPAILEAAYNDSEAVTAAFNLNLLVRIERELEADLCLEQFEHLAFYNQPRGRIEMHLRSTVPQTIRLDHTEVELAADETIHTENSYKYARDEFEPIAARAGFEAVETWTDEEGLFSVQYYERD